MEQGFSILMFIFSGALLLYAVLLAITKDYDMLPRRGAVPVKPENRKEYTFQISKVIALTALAPAAGGLAGLWNEMAGFLVMVIGFVIAMWAGIKIMRKAG